MSQKEGTAVSTPKEPLGKQRGQSKGAEQRKDIGTDICGVANCRTLHSGRGGGGSSSNLLEYTNEAAILIQSQTVVQCQKWNQEHEHHKWIVGMPRSHFAPP